MAMKDHYRGVWLMLMALAIGLAGCREKPGIDWDLDAQPPTSDVTPAATPPSAIPAADRAASQVRFISHNVENWLLMERGVDGRSEENAPKPEDQKHALVTLIARHQPDILGLCEIGTPDDLADIRTRLRKAGVDLPYTHHHQGSDSVRSLGLLSRHPITSTSKAADTSFRLTGRRFEMLRGILDATVTTPDGRDFRFLGVHFKSKRETSRYDQAQFRIQEAHCLRAHIDAILRDDPAARLVVFGDLNDTRRSYAVTTIAGAYGSNLQLLPVPARDSRRQMWTHHWRYQDVYSRIDYVFLTPALRDEADFDNARVLDDPEWRKASDHRPILLDFLPPR